MSSLRELLRQAKSALSEDVRKVFVMGNTSCDSDSLCCTIGFACFRNLMERKKSTPPQTLFVPVLNFERARFNTMLQQNYWLQDVFSIDYKEDVLFLEDFPGETAPDSSTDNYFFLVDHNAVDPRQKSFLKKRVTGCLDHHELSNDFHSDILIDEGGPVERDVVDICPPSGPKLVGSSTSQVLEYVAKNAEGLGQEDVVAEIRDLLCGGVLMDTLNFSGKTLGVKWSQYDRDSFDNAHKSPLKTSTKLSLEDDGKRKAIFDILCGVKFDIDRNLAMGLFNLLGTDYKRFEYTCGAGKVPGADGKKYAFGYATCAVPLDRMNSHWESNPENFFPHISKFAKQEGVEFVIILTSDANLNRHFALYTDCSGEGGEVRKNAYTTLIEQLTPELELVNIQSFGDDSGMKMDFFEQKKTSYSRKQVAPAVGKVLEG